MVNKNDQRSSLNFKEKIIKNLNFISTIFLNSYNILLSIIKHHRFRFIVTIIFTLSFFVIIVNAVAKESISNNRQYRLYVSLKTMNCTNSSILMRGNDPYLLRTGCYFSYIGKYVDFFETMHCEHTGFNPKTDIFTLYDCAIEAKVMIKPNNK